ncbi:MAG: glycosyltransferase [Isosphaeraceae bacterium]|nr:glycosyltransferase [Isosphaeraceae bacterium]
MTIPAEQPPGAAPAVRRPLRIIWEGSQALVHSFALVNRELCLKLIERGHELSIRPSGAHEQEAEAAEVHPRVAARFHQPLSGPPDVCVRHQWPPHLTPPPSGRWVIMQPWEYGSLPKAWIAPMSTLVDEVWVPSRFVRDCCVASGIPAERVHVIPLGVDPTRFRPDASPLPLAAQKRFKFLFVGGTLHRKGIDVLLEAYSRAFSAADDVCLMIKDLGAATFYQGQTAGDLIARIQTRPDSPTITYIDRTLTGDELAGLYTACDCLVHPYRGEGFGLPIAEAMACGLPVIVTGHGAAQDFCNANNAYLIPARRTRFARRRIGDLETVADPWMWEPDRHALERLMRRVFEYPVEAKSRGRAATNHIYRGFTWKLAADKAERRLMELVGDV